MNQYGSPIVRFGFGIGAIFFVLGGPISGFFLFRIFLEAKASAAWPTVIGTLTRAQVRTTDVGRYFADVAYTYRVGDAEFTGSRVRASDGEFNIREGAEQAIQGLVPGKPIPVFYNPSNPRVYVLQAGAGFQEYVLLVVPIGMFLIGVWSFRMLWRTRARN